MEFLKTDKRFSFKLNGINAWEINYSKEVSVNENTVTTVYNFEDGLKITNIAKKYEKYGAYEWVNYIENTSDKPTGIISELWDCDCELPLSGGENRKWRAYFDEPQQVTRVYAPTGSTNVTEEFYSQPDKAKRNRKLNHLYTGEGMEFSASGGRSSEENAPFFNVNINNDGYIFAIGWTGQWKCRMERTEETLIFKSKVEDTHFKVLPGEKFRTSSVVILPYKNGFINAQNSWRRLVKEHFSIIGQEGRAQYGPFCAGIWGGMKTGYVLERIEKIKKHKLPFEYLWMDAGWFGEETKDSLDEFESDWNSRVGDWRESKHVHPDGLGVVADAVKDAGLKFLLWFEVERVLSTTPVPKKHPEYFLSNKVPEEITRFLNFGREDAWKYCFDMLSDYIERMHISCYRQDFNAPPLSYWRINDDEDRQGITEIKYITGMYRLWDALLEKFPHLIIDNCASGGRRIDIETLRRSIPLWRSDYQCRANCDVETTQFHHLTFNTWLPYSGTSSGREYSEYRIRSSYDSAMTTNYTFSAKETYLEDENQVEFMKKYTAEYLKVRPYFSEDFYPLTEPSANLDVWCGAQFNRPENGDGIIQLFRRDNSPHATAEIKLYAINEKANYLISDADGGEFTVSGKELCEKGFVVTIPEKRKAKLYFYKEI